MDRQLSGFQALRREELHAPEDFVFKGEDQTHKSWDSLPLLLPCSVWLCSSAVSPSVQSWWAHRPAVPIRDTDRPGDNPVTPQETTWGDRGRSPPPGQPWSHPAASLSSPPALQSSLPPWLPFSAAPWSPCRCPPWQSEAAGMSQRAGACQAAGGTEGDFVLFSLPSPEN